LELENERRTTVRTSKNAADNGDSAKGLQKEITELKSQLAKQTQLTEKAKSETVKVKEDWEKQKSVLESKLDKEKGKNKTLQEKKNGIDCEISNVSVEEESVGRGSRSSDAVSHETISNCSSKSGFDETARSLD
jgi:hypothetical protein